MQVSGTVPIEVIATVSILCFTGWIGAACAPTYSTPVPEQVVRRVGGVRRSGRFVSPYCYEWYTRGELFAARGEYDLAAGAFRKALAGPEEDPFVMARLADSLDRLGRYREALAVLNRAERIDPDSEAVWLTRAEIAERHEELDAAIAALERAEAAAPASAEPTLRLARLLEKTSARERALAVLERFERRSDEGGANAARARLALAVSRGDAASAARAVDALVSVGPVHAEQVRDAARLALDAGDAELARRIIERLPRADGDNRLRLRILIESGRFDAAEMLLATGAVDSFGGLVETASAYLVIDRPQMAEELARTALAANQTPAALVVAAEASLRLGRYDRAAVLFAEVPEASSDFARARQGLAQALTASGLAELAKETLAARKLSTKRQKK
jgi:tetratricopeptide (TPR) repeat protein